MKLPAIRFSIRHLLVLIALVAVGLFWGQRHLAWTSAESEFREMIASHACTPEDFARARQLVTRYPQLAAEWDAMNWAVRYGDVDLCEFLLRHGANPNKSGSLGEPPLYWAMQRDRIDLAKLLFRNGADVSVDSDLDGCVVTRVPGIPIGSSLLHVAAWRGDIEMCQLLLDQGMTTHSGNALGQSPLHGAVLSRDLAIVQLMIDHNASDAADNSGLTPKELAVRLRTKYPQDAAEMDEIARVLDALIGRPRYTSATNP